MTWLLKHNEAKKRWCSSCRTSPDTDGGEYILYNNGLNRRWVCQSCKEKHLENRRSKKTA